MDLSFQDILKLSLCVTVFIESLNNLESNSDAGKMCSSSNRFLSGLSEKDIGKASLSLITVHCSIHFNVSIFLFFASLLFYYAEHIIAFPQILGRTRFLLCRKAFVRPSQQTILSVNW